MTTVTVTTVGSSTGIVLPKEIREYLGVEKGDNVTFVRDNGSIRIIRHDKEYDKWMEAGHSLMERYSDTLRKLAE